MASVEVGETSRLLTSADLPTYITRVGDLKVVITVSSDFGDNISETWPAQGHVHRLIEELEKRGIQTQGICPGASAYEVIDNSPTLHTIYNFRKKKVTGAPCTLYKRVVQRVDGPLKRRDLLFIGSYDEASEKYLSRVMEWQTQFLSLLANRYFNHVINNPFSERWTLKNNSPLMAVALPAVPFVPTTMIQNKRQMAAYLRRHGRVVGKPYNKAGGRGIMPMRDKDEQSWSVSELLAKYDLFPKYVFQPLLKFEEEREIPFINGVALGVIKKHQAEPWSEGHRSDQVGELTPEERMWVKSIADFTGLAIGRVDFILSSELVEGSDRAVLEVNGSGSGMFWYTSDGEVIEDYTPEVVDHLIAVMYGEDGGAVSSIPNMSALYITP